MVRSKSGENCAVATSIPLSAAASAIFSAICALPNWQTLARMPSKQALSKVFLLVPSNTLTTAFTAAF